jgi:hypothetical protein
MKLNRMYYTGTFITLLLCSSGCATNSELRRVRNEVHETRHTAEQALNLAREANNRAERTEEMMHRSFKHSMRK